MYNCDLLILTTPTGPNGLNGWSPILAYQNGDEGVGLYVVDWFGGTGAKPAVGQFLGAVIISSVAYLPLPAPATPVSGAVQYFDEADNILKIKFSDGSIMRLRP